MTDIMNLTIFNNNLFVAGTEFFNQLGIRLNSNTATSIEAQKLLKDHFKDQGIFKEITETYFLGLVDDSVFDGSVPLLNKEKISLKEAEARLTTEYNGLMVFAVGLKDSYSPTRGEIADLTRAFNRVSKSVPVVLLLKYGGLLSFAASERTKYKQAWREGEKIGKISLLKDIKIDAPHTGHLKILDDLKVAPAVKDFNALYKQWQEVFNVRLLNNKFYQEIFYWYLWAVKEVKFPQMRPKEDLISDDAHQSESVIRLLTRLLFCWFMKEKQELIPELLFDKREVKKILNDFSPEKDKSSVYYRAILQNLFFATLSVPIKNRKYIRESFQGKNKDYGNSYVYRYQSEFADAKENLRLFKDIPFLNGGLFECLDEVPENDDEKEIRLDGFSSKEKKQAFVPDYLFWGEHSGIDLSEELDKPQKKNETVHGIIDILNSYKFTIEENTPLEEEIALDPELLGKVFESLLAYYNPETKANARKQTGSFYTPREIVNYMVDESLLATFQQKLSDAGITDNVEQRLRDLISYNETENSFSERETNVIIQALENLKVLDPACGSGAFPMGILHKLVWVLRKVDPENKKWFESIIKRLPDYAQAEMRKKLEGENWDYLRKLGVIQQSIYGVDIQPIAIQIAKLRFFISLLVDQDIKGNGENNFGLQPLPNLDFKLVAANTLIGAPEHNQQEDGKLLFGQDEFFDKFNALTGQYFGTYDPAEKRKLVKKIEKIVSNKVQEKVDEIQRLGTHTDERFSKHLAEKKKAIIEQKRNDAKLWQSYNNLFKHESVGFFETKYFFPEVENGFDIVIGNPPYISVEKFSGTSLQEKWKALYQTYAARGDIYCFFYERGLDLINKHGNLCYISSNKFMRAGYGKGLRKLLANQLIEKVIDFCELPVFSASTDPAIILLKKESPDKDTQVFAAVIKEESEIYDLPQALLKRGLSLPLAALKPEGWTIEDQDGLGLIEKMRTKGKPLGEYVNGRLYYGIKTGLNEAFVIDRTARDQLIEEDPQSDDLIRKWIRGKDIKRWRGEWNNWYVIVFPYGFHPELNNYPAILRHLSKFEKDLKERGQCRTSRSGKEEGQHHWLELDNNPKPEYLEAFNKPKIVFNETSKELHAYVDTEGYAINKTGFIILADEPYYVLSVLNSSALDYLYRCEFPSWGDPWKGGRVQFRGDRMAGVPIPVASDEQKRKLTSLAHAAAKASGVQLKKIEDEINQIVCQLFGLSEDEIALIESSIPKSESPGGLDNKTALFTRILPALKNQAPYFSLESVKRALDDSEIELADETLREYMSEAMASGIVQDAGRGWYSRHEKPVSLDPKPLAKIIRTVEKAFPLLDFCCWSTVQFNLFAQHLIAQPTVLLYAESDALESVADRLREAGWNAWANPNQKEAEKLVRPGEKSIVLRPAISKQPESTNHVASIEKALVDLMVEAPKLQLMDYAETQRILDTCLQSGLVQLPVLMTYSERRSQQFTSTQITN